jgi:hypothetical protein
MEQTDVPIGGENAGQIIRGGKGSITVAEGKSCAGGEKHEKMMLKKYVRSRNVYENKQISDNVPGKESDIYVLDSDILYKRTCILQNFAETASLSVTFRARGNEFFASKYTTSRPRRDGSRRGKAATSRRTPKIRISKAIERPNRFGPTRNAAPRESHNRSK